MPGAATGSVWRVTVRHDRKAYLLERGIGRQQQRLEAEAEFVFHVEHDVDQVQRIDAYVTQSGCSRDAVVSRSMSIAKRSWRVDNGLFRISSLDDMAAPGLNACGPGRVSPGRMRWCPSW